MDDYKSSGFSGYSQASALSSMPINAGGKIFSTPSAIPPPLEETLPTDMIDWPRKDVKKRRM